MVTNEARPPRPAEHEGQWSRVTLPRFPLGRAHHLAFSTIRDARRAGIRIELLPAGSLRRFRPDIGDVLLLGVAPAAAHVWLRTQFARLPSVTGVVEEREDALTVTTSRGMLTVRLTTPSQVGAHLVWHTGSRHHTNLLRERAARLGLHIADDGTLTDAAGILVPTPSEAEFYRRLGLPFIPPELRTGTDEVMRAEDAPLPELISDLHIRGDLHMHSIWSDGRNTIEEMVRGSRQLGYEYVAISDHSERSTSSRKLQAADIPAQRREIDTVGARIPGIAILHGIEVEIMRDGSLDFDDDTLAQFDIVLASLHDHGGQDARTLEDRYLRAIEHPLVAVITHPANRTPAHSAGYALDFDRLFEAAARTGTAMEIDGAPGHLDMDGTLARRAVTAGVTVCIDSDCHRVDALSRQMRWGLGTARRGWVEPRHVLNTRPLEDVQAFIARKRGR